MYQRILVATDGSALAERAVKHAIGLARTHRAALSVVTVSELWSPFDMAHEALTGSREPIADYEAKVGALAKKILDRAVSEAIAQGVEAEAIHVEGKRPAEGILGAADKAKAEVIVMASHGRRGANRLLLGSQALEVMTHSKLPVLIVR